MGEDEAVLAALSDLRAAFPAMRVGVEHVALGDGLTVFRATIALPSGAEATGYGSVAGSGVDAIARAETRALARAMALLGVDAEDYDPTGLDGDDTYAEDEPAPAPAPTGRPAPARATSSSRSTTSGTSGTSGTGASGLTQAVAEDAPADPFNLGPAPSAAAVASATGMRLGARDGGGLATATRSTPPRPAAPEPESYADEEPDDGGPGDGGDPDREAGEREEPPGDGDRRPAGRAETAAAPPATETETEEDAGVSHQAFWRWAGDRGLRNRADVEDLIGQSIGGMRPAAVRDMILAAQDES